MALALRSTTGCLTCRRRRIKCDENRPLCLRCQKAKTNCLWSGERPAVQCSKPSIVLGNAYATLFLQSEDCDFAARPKFPPSSACPVTALSSGHVPFHDQREHDALIKLDAFLSMLNINPSGKMLVRPKFEFRVALQERWVRDAMLALAALIVGRTGKVLHQGVHPYYVSASRAVRFEITQRLDEDRLEKLLVASLFLGMIEFSDPDNIIFPLLHFEAVGRVLDHLHTVQRAEGLSPDVLQFHRIALESYVYHMSVQSLFYPQADRFPTLSPLVDDMIRRQGDAVGRNMIIGMDLKAYVILFELTRLARQTNLTHQASELARDISRTLEKLQQKAHEQLQRLVVVAAPKSRDYWELTATAAHVLSIFSMKVLDRSLRSDSPALRQPVESALRCFEACKPTRHWTGNFAWLFIILVCGACTIDESARITQKLRDMSAGLWGADARRVKRVLKMVRNEHTWPALAADTAVSPCRDSLDILVEGRLSMIPNPSVE